MAKLATDRGILHDDPSLAVAAAYCKPCHFDKLLITSPKSI